MPFVLCNLSANGFKIYQATFNRVYLVIKTIFAERTITTDPFSKVLQSGKSAVGLFYVSLRIRFLTKHTIYVAKTGTIYPEIPLSPLIPADSCYSNNGLLGQ
jgi:hypothetical protein